MYALHMANNNNLKLLFAAPDRQNMCLIVRCRSYIINIHKNMDTFNSNIIYGGDIIRSLLSFLTDYCIKKNTIVVTVQISLEVH